MSQATETFDFVVSRVYGYKLNFFSHSFYFSLHTRRRQRFAGGHFAKSDDKKIELNFITYSVVTKLIPT